MMQIHYLRFSYAPLYRHKLIIQRFTAILLLVVMVFITGLKALHHHHPEVCQVKDRTHASHEQFRESHDYCPVCDFHFSTLASPEDNRLELYGIAGYGCLIGYNNDSVRLSPGENNMRLRGPPVRY